MVWQLHSHFAMREERMRQECVYVIEKTRKIIVSHLDGTEIIGEGRRTDRGRFAQKIVTNCRSYYHKCIIVSQLAPMRTVEKWSCF